MIDFEWDITKAKTNLRKHRVAFSEATTVFRDRLSITIHDPDHPVDEDRYHKQMKGLSEMSGLTLTNS